MLLQVRTISMASDLLMLTSVLAMQRMRPSCVSRLFRRQEEAAGLPPGHHARQHTLGIHALRRVVHVSKAQGHLLVGRQQLLLTGLDGRSRPLAPPTALCWRMTGSSLCSKSKGDQRHHSSSTSRRTEQGTCVT